MTYRRITELPDNVRNHLPRHAQQIYKRAFNRAWNQYRDLDGSRGGAPREETAHRMAWWAVKSSYERIDGGSWVKK